MAKMQGASVGRNMVAPDTLGQAEEEKEFDDLSVNQQMGVLVSAVFAGFALVGVIVKYGLEKDDAEIRSAWAIGKAMEAGFFRRVKEKANGR